MRLKRAGSKSQRLLFSFRCKMTHWGVENEKASVCMSLKYSSYHATGSRALLPCVRRQSPPHGYPCGGKGRGGGAIRQPGAALSACFVLIACCACRSSRVGASRVCRVYYPAVINKTSEKDKCLHKTSKKPRLMLILTI